MPVPDTAAVGDSGHVGDHNDIAAELTALPSTYAALSPAGQQRLAAQSAVALRPWHAALANRASAAAQVLFIGDSVTEGALSSTRGKRWTDLAAAQIRRSLGITAGAGGFIATGRASALTWPTEWTFTGGTPGNGGDIGPSRYTSTISAGMTASITVTGTSVDLWTTNGGASAVLAASVDGGGTIATVDAGTGGVKKTRIALGISGSHTLTLTHSSGSTAYINGVDIFNSDEDTGVRTFNAGHYGYTSTNYVAGLNGSTSTVDKTWQTLQPHLVVISLGTNDWASGVTAATFKTNIQNLITYLRADVTIDPAFVLMPIYQRNVTPSPADNNWGDYVQAMYDIVAADAGVTIWDMSLRMPAVAGDALGLYADTSHPSDKGHAMIADAFAQFLIPR